MASYRQFEDLPVWQAAIDLAATVFDLTSHPAFKFRGDLVNQIRRAALSVSNNIAEGFERGTVDACRDLCGGGCLGQAEAWRFVDGECRDGGADRAKFAD